MLMLIIICATLIISLSLNVYFKTKSYKKSDKSLWEDGDSVCVKGNKGDAQEYHFMNRIA
ncbi:MAG: hypothetical protein K6E86_09775 [Bacteroidales bacterium]|nr:hypothetical protein [Bacteroidales bacterium]